MPDSLTSNFSLPLPNFNKKLWQEDFYRAMRIIDAVLGQYISVNNLQGVWDNATVYTAGQRAVDEDSGVIYDCLISHTSPTTGTFAEARTTSPLNWEILAINFSARGAWAASTSYELGDFISYLPSGIFAMCTVAHTSSGTFANDSDNWSYLINASQMLSDIDADVAAAAASAAAAALSAAALNFPTIVASRYLRSKSDASGYEFLTAAELLTAIGAYADTGGTISGAVTVTGNSTLSGTLLVSGAATFSSTLTLNGDPASALQAATKQYVDALVAGLNPKASVRVATTGAGTLATSFDNGETIDGIVIATGDRILIKDQAAPAENGIYIVAASGAPTRASDANSWAELISAYCFVQVGTANADKCFLSTIDAGGTLETTSVTFTEFGAQIANDAITFAKMQNIDTQTIIGRNTGSTGDPEQITVQQILDWLSTTQGVILYYNGTDWVALAPGTSGQYLKTLGAGANPAWADVSQVWEYVSSVTASASSNIDFQSLASGYDYQVIWDGVYTSAANEMGLRVESGGSWQTATYLTACNRNAVSFTATAYIPVGYNMGSTSARLTGGQVTIINPAATGVKPIIGQSFGKDNADAAQGISIHGTWNGGTGAVTGLRFMMSGGETFTSGTFLLYRRRRS